MAFMWLKANRASAVTVFVMVIVFSISENASRGASEKLEKYWVQAVQADLKEAPQMNAKSVQQLKRGDPVLAIGKKDFWVEIKKGNSSGWISKIFLTDHAPVGNADLGKDLNTTMEKTSRQRSSSFAVQAATRGFTAPGRSRQFEGKLAPDYLAVRNMENYVIDGAKLSAFKTEAKMGGF